MKRQNFLDYIFHSVNYIVFTIFSLMCIYPFYYIFLNTLSNSAVAAKKTIVFLPVGFTLDNYKQIFQLNGIPQAFLISTSRAVIGTLVTLFFTSMFAYVLTKRELFLRKFMYRTVVVSMYLSAGLIPWYITMKYLRLQNNFLLYVIPSAISAFALILIKTYIEQLPAALEESAIIDGAGSFSVFIKIILPLSGPILAAVGVFSAVGQWNSWSDNFFLVNKPSLNTLQLTLLNFLRQADAIARAAVTDTNSVKYIQVTPMSVRMTITMVATIPILLVYPSLQKYFVKGIMIGAIKG